MMASRKLLTSVLLVFTYLLGLAHEMIPHAHHDAPGSAVVMPLEAADPNHQNCLHSDDSTSKNQLADESVCTSNHHYPPLCNVRSLYLPSLPYSFSAPDGSADVFVASLLGYAISMVVVAGKKPFPPDSDVLISNRGPNEISLRGPPAFSC